VDYKFLGGFDGTIVLYMAMGTWPRSRKAVEGARMHRCRSRSFRMRRRRSNGFSSHGWTGSADCAEQGFEAPSIVIIGPTAAATTHNGS